MSEKRDYYEVLGVERSATADEIKRSYRKKAMEFHPDRNQGAPEAATKFKEAAEAYDVLGDEEKRKRYDQFGHAGVGGFSDTEFTGNPADIFSTLFSAFGRNDDPKDLRIPIHATLEELDKGFSRDIEIVRAEQCSACKGSGARKGTHPIACSTCRGSGQVRADIGIMSVRVACPMCRGEGKTVDPCSECSGRGRIKKKTPEQIIVPPGVISEGDVEPNVASYFVLRGKGDAGRTGTPRGDLHVIVLSKDHRIFQRSGADVMTEIPVSFAQLTLGDTVELPTLRGKAEMTIPAGTQSGKVFRLRGQGLPQLEGRARGDQLVRVFVQTPKDLSERQKQLLREFEKLEQERTGKKSFFEKLAEYFA